MSGMPPGRESSLLEGSRDHESPVRVAVDAMGGDRAPDEIVAGALEAWSDAIQPVLFGPRELVEPLARGLEVVDAQSVVAMDEKAADAARDKRDSSLFLACRAVGQGAADVVVSAGNTGAMLVAGLLEIRRLPDVHRPAIAVPIPARRHVYVLIDAGANADARPEHLLQFAWMGSIFAEEVLEIANPEIKLLSIGEEPDKGNRLTREAFPLLEASGLRFTGNVEGRELLEGPCDVVVCDGFTGNVVLKCLEGTIRTVFSGLRDELGSTVLGRLGGAMIRPSGRRIRDRLNPDTYGGAYLLGLRGLAVIAHGNSSRAAIANAVRLGARGVDHGVLDRLAAGLAERSAVTS
jgi:glycerol-3-phosphate acyltransferase PlsX